jgi:hypothetical protein
MLWTAQHSCYKALIAESLTQHTAHLHWALASEGDAVKLLSDVSCIHGLLQSYGCYAVARALVGASYGFYMGKHGCRQQICCRNITSSCRYMRWRVLCRSAAGSGCRQLIVRLAQHTS